MRAGARHVVLPPTRAGEKLKLPIFSAIRLGKPNLLIPFTAYIFIALKSYLNKTFFNSQSLSKGVYNARK